LNYLDDFAWSFYILFGPLFNFMASGIISLGFIMAAGWAILARVTRRGA
jgi:hypothetical protein